MSVLPGPGNQVRLVIALAFLLSGFSCLVYEIVWMQLLVAVFGVTYYAIVTIVTSFMAGLALGALVVGRVADRQASPLAIYVGLEVGVALFALAFPYIAEQLTGWYPYLHSRFQLDFFALSLVRFAVCGAILLLPATAMGATLPLLTRYVVRDSSRVGSDVGLLYGVNTVGAALGCAVTGFFLVWALGLRGSNLLAVALTLTAAALILGVLLADRRRPPSVSQPAPQEHGAPSRAAMPVSALLLGLFFLSGFTSMAYELLWTRVFTMFHTNPQTSVFTLILSLYLLGMGLGSALYRYLGYRVAPIAMFGGLQLAVGVLMAVMLALFHHRGAILSDVTPSTLHSLVGMWLYETLGVVFFPWELLLAVAVVFVPGVIFGLTFPLSSALYIRRIERLGRGVGLVYFAITVGGIAGSITAGFFMMPMLSLKNSILLLAAINLAIGVYLLVWRRQPGWTRRRVVVALAPAVGAAVLLGWLSQAMPAWAFLPLNSGDSVVWYGDGRNVSSGVVDRQMPDGRTRRHVYTSGEQVGGWGGGEQYPLMLSPAPDSVLTVGFGAGGTLARFARFDGIKELVAVDIDDNQPRMLPWLPPPGATLTSDPRFRLVGDDGRNHLFTTTRQYDVLFNDAGTYTHYRELGTTEHLEVCRDRLTPGGLFLHKLHTEIITLDAFQRAVATFVQVFPDATLWSGGGPVFFLVGFKSEPERDYGALVGRSEAARTGYPDAPAPQQVAATYLASGDGLRALAGEASPFSDNRVPPMQQLFVLPNITESSIEGRHIRLENAARLVDAVASVAPDEEFFTDILPDHMEEILARRQEIWDALRTFTRPPPLPPQGRRVTRTRGEQGAPTR